MSPLPVKSGYVFLLAFVLIVAASAFFVVCMVGYNDPGAPGNPEAVDSVVSNVVDMDVAGIDSSGETGGGAGLPGSPDEAGDLADTGIDGGGAGVGTVSSRAGDDQPGGTDPLAGDTRIIKRAFLSRGSGKYPLIRVEHTLAVSGGREELMETSRMVGDHIIVKVHDGIDRGRLDSFNERFGGKIRASLIARGTYLVCFDNADAGTVPLMIGEYGRAKDLVEYCEPDYIVSAPGVKGPLE